MNTLILTTDAQFQGIFAVAVLVCALVLGFAVVGNGSKKAADKIRKKYAGNILEEGTGGKLCWFLTDKELLIQKYTDIFAVYRLDEIRYVSARRDPAVRQWVFLMLDSEQKVIKPAALIGGTAAGQKLYGRSVDIMPQNAAEQLCMVVQRYVPGVEKI